MEKRCTMKIEILRFSFRFYSVPRCLPPVIYGQVLCVHMHSTTVRNDFMQKFQTRQRNKRIKCRITSLYAHCTIHQTCFSFVCYRISAN